MKDVQLIEKTPIIARYFAFQYKDNNLTQVVLYWYETSTFTTNSTSQQKHVKISLIMYPTIQEPEDQLLTFATAIANYWQPMKTWSQIALLISQNGNILTMFPIATLIFTLTFYIISQKREKKTNLKVYKKLADEDQKIIEAVKETQQKTLSTLNNIASTYQKLTKENVNMETLLNKLRQAKEISLVQEEIENVHDQPTLVWKTRGL